MKKLFILILIFLLISLFGCEKPMEENVPNPSLENEMTDFSEPEVALKENIKLLF